MTDGGGSPGVLVSEEFGQAVAGGGQDDAVVGLEDVAGAEVPHEAGAWRRLEPYGRIAA